MKRLVAVLLSATLCFPFALPASAFAAGNDAMQGEETSAQDSAESEEFDPYRSYGFLDASAGDRLELPEGVEKMATPKGGEGVRVQLPKNFAGGRFRIADAFDFSTAPVSRFMFDGLAERNKDATISFFLDDAVDPFVSFKMRCAQGKTEWAFAGSRMQVLDTAIEDGPHAISFSVDAGGTKTEVLFRSFVFMQDTGLPTLEFAIDESRGTVDAMNGSESHNRECYGNMLVHVPAGYAYEYTGAVASSATTETYAMDYIRGRGNSTWSNDKKPYKVKLSKKNSLLGMGKNKHWVLLANRYDPSLMRNKITYWMGDELGMSFTPKCVFVDVVMNGDYYGSYYLCEQVRVGEGRVDIDDLEDENMQTATEEPEISGGYLLNMDYGDEGIAIKTNKEYEFHIESPSFEDWENPQQVAYITNYLNNFEAALYGDGFKDANGRSYSEFLDTDAAIDYYWMQMMTMNGDAYGSGSTYLFKGRDGTEHSKLTWGPLWDFDYVAWGDLEYSSYSTEGFSTESAPWLSRLLQDDAFAQKMRARWSTIREKLVEITRAGGKLDQYAEQLALSQRYDTDRWGSYSEGYGEYSGYAERYGTGGYAAGNGTEGNAETSQATRTYADEVEQLRGWIVQRMEWIDENLDTLKPPSTTLTFEDRGTVVETRDVLLGEEIGQLPILPTRKGYVLGGWYAVDAEGEAYEIGSYSMVDCEDMVVQARWIKLSKVTKAKKLAFLLDEAWVGIWPQEPEESGTVSMPYDVFPADAQYMGITWSSSDPEVATVDSYGEVTGHKAGTAVITATCIGGVKASYTLHFVDVSAEDLDYPEGVLLDTNELTVHVGAAAKVGVGLTPQPCWFTSVSFRSLDESVASVGPGGMVLGCKAGTTYIMASTNDMYTYELCKVTVLASDLADAKVKLKNKRVAFNGKKRTPKVSSVKIGGKTLRAGKDYTVKLPKKRTKVGTYTIRVVGKGAFCGAKTVKFSIVPPKATLEKPKAKKNSIAVKVKKLSKKQLSQVSGYRVRWSTSEKFVNFKTVGVSLKKKSAKATLRKLKASGRHYIQVSTYKVVKGKKYYSAWSKGMSVK